LARLQAQIIAHDVGRSHDRSTAVVGGNSPYGRRLLGIKDIKELPQNLYGSALASALAGVDAYHGRNALIVAEAHASMAQEMPRSSCRDDP
jgi:hypothetical protein